MKVCDLCGDPPKVTAHGIPLFITTPCGDFCQGACAVAAALVRDGGPPDRSAEDAPTGALVALADHATTRELRAAAMREIARRNSLRVVRWSFSNDPLIHVGFTDGSRWSGWLNVWVTPGRDPLRHERARGVIEPKPATIGGLIPFLMMTIVEIEPLDDQCPDCGEALEQDAEGAWHHLSTSPICALYPAVDRASLPAGGV